MINYSRPVEQNMYDLHCTSASPAPVRLDDFQVFRRGPTPHLYEQYYSNLSYDSFAEPDIESSVNVYHNLLSCREYYKDEWKKKFVVDWNEDDTVSWIIDTMQFMGITSEYEVPFHSFRVTGAVLVAMTREEIIQTMCHLQIDSHTAKKIGDHLYNKLLSRINEDMSHTPYDRSLIRYADGESSCYQHDQTQTVLDLDSFDHRNRSDYMPNNSSLLQGTCDSSDDAEEVFRSSPECSYASDVSKSGDEDDKHKRQFKRPPGRPKGSGRKVCKRPRSVSVPEFLRNLLLDHKYCPSIIKWEDRTHGKFRFVKPDEVAKLWGKLKQNDNMTFEKFSRAMRYHYKQSVLVSVPTARLVYQFGPKGPEFRADTYVHVKSEMAELNHT